MSSNSYPGKPLTALELIGNLHEHLLDIEGGKDERSPAVIARVAIAAIERWGPLNHDGKFDRDRAYYKPLCEGGPLYVRGECGECDMLAPNWLNGDALAPGAK